MDQRLEIFLRYFFCVVFSIASLLKIIFTVIQNGINTFRITPRDTPPAILSDKRWGTHRYIRLKNQGVKLHYVENGDKSKPLILFLHGFPELWLSWRHQLEEFSSKYWVIAVDMRGYGESDKPKGKENYKLELLIDDVKEFVEELGKPKTTLVGHDWGGAIAWAVVGKYPEMFEKHISINGPRLETFKSLIMTSFNQFKMSWYIFFFQCPFLPEILLRLNNLESVTQVFRGSKNLIKEFPDEFIEALQFYFSKPGAFTPPLNYYRKVFDYEGKASSGKIKVPTLIIWGDTDLALSKDLPKYMARACEKCEIELISEAGHFVQQERPLVVNAAMWNFLKE